MSFVKKYGFAIVAFSVLFVTLLVWRDRCRPFADDFMFTHVYEVDEYTAEAQNYLGEPITTLPQALVSIYRHHIVGNGRLAGDLRVLMSFFPEWALNLICALSIALMPLLMLLVAGGRPLLRRPLIVSATIVLMWLAFPWNDGMESADFIFNYPLAACLVLWVMLLWPGATRSSTASFVATCVLTLIACAMHEGFTVTLMVWMVADMLLSPHKPAAAATRRRIILLAMAFIGFLITVVPSRFIGFGEVAVPHWAMQWTSFLGYRMPIIFIILLVWAMFSHRFVADTRRRLIAIAVAMLSEVALIIVVMQSGRAYWPAILFGFIGVIMIADRAIPLQADSRRSVMVASWSLLCIYAIFIWQVIHWQGVVQRNYYTVHHLLTSSPATGPVFFDVPPVGTFPWWTMGLPLDKRYRDYCNMLFEGQATGYSPHILATVAPTSCRNLPISQWQKIPGDNPFHGSFSGPFFTDTPLDSLSVEIAYGNLTRSANLLNSAIIMARGGDTHAARQVHTLDGPYYAGTYLGDSIYAYFPSAPRRFCAGRRPIRADIVKQPLTRN